MKPIRNALASPGRISGRATVVNVPPPFAAQRLGGLLHRRAHALDDAKEHEKGDGGECEHLDDHSAWKTVEPACRWYAEHVREEDR